MPGEQVTRRQPSPSNTPPAVPQAATAPLAGARGSVTFAVVTLLFYVFVYPVGLILNIVGLLAGPRRGCFFSLLFFFLLLPAIVIFMVVKTGTRITIPIVQDVIRYLEAMLRHFGV